MMNILYLHTHDSGRYFDPYGHHIGTPALNRLAREATVFRQAFSMAPTCSPSRAGLLTGRSPHSVGMLGLAHRGFRLTDYDDHAVRILGSQGWETALCGIQHEAEPVDLIGYEHILDSANISMANAYGFDPVEYDLNNSRIAADFIGSRTQEDRPFFLSVGLFNTHREFPPIDPSIDPQFVRPPVEVPDTRDTRDDFAAYMTSARVVDQCVGTVIEALKEAGLREKTIIIFTTDHGLAIPFHKCSLYDTGIGVALILDFPGNPARATVCDALVSHADILPTICDLVGLPAIPGAEGSSLIPLLAGDVTEIRSEVYAEVTFHARYEPQRAIRTKEFKLIKRYGDHPHPVPVNIDPSASKRLLFEERVDRFPWSSTFLFDLGIDPVERVNLADNEDYADVRQDLETRLTKWMEASGDPLLDGPVKLPPGAYQDGPNTHDHDRGDYEYGEPVKEEIL